MASRQLNGACLSLALSTEKLPFLVAIKHESQNSDQCGSVGWSVIP